MCRQLDDLRKAGLRLVFLSNMTASVLATASRKPGSRTNSRPSSAPTGLSYKPDPRTYRLAMDQLSLSREEVLFVAFASWDVAGAEWFGYPTFWLNRAASPAEELGVEADASGQDLSSLVQFVRGRAR